MNQLIEEIEESVERINSKLISLNEEMRVLLTIDTRMAKLKATNEDLRNMLKQIIQYVPGDAVGIDSSPLRVSATKMVLCKE